MERRAQLERGAWLQELMAMIPVRVAASPRAVAGDAGRRIQSEQ